MKTIVSDFDGPDPGDGEDRPRELSTPSDRVEEFPGVRYGFVPLDPGTLGLRTHLAHRNIPSIHGVTGPQSPLMADSGLSTELHFG